MQKLILFLSPILLLVSCATERQYHRNMRNWKGKSEAELVSNWGAPNKSYTLQNGDKVLTYNKNDNTTASSIGGSTFFSSDTCNTNFTVSQKGIILLVKWDGNDCTAY